MSVIGVIKKITTVALAILAVIPGNSAIAGVGGFYNCEDRYRGFYWFEDKRGELQDNNSLSFYYPTNEEAQNGIEARKKEMDDARAQMVELGFREDTPSHILRQAIVKYKKLEAKMHDGAIRLVHASEEANFTNPEIANLLEHPTNVYANKIKRIADEREKIATIKEFAKKFDLLLFANADCPYSQAFTPVITNFAQEHGFTLEIASLDSSAGKIAQRLGINAVPTLVAVGKDGNSLFELSRGLQSVSELESSTVLANNLSKEKQSLKFNSYKNKR